MNGWIDYYEANNMLLSDEHVTPFLPSQASETKVSFIIGRTVSLTNMHIGVIFDAEEHACLVQEFLTVLYMTFGRQGRKVK
jgi:hypothetical protein